MSNLTTTIDVYGQVIPNNSLFVTVWYMYLVTCILTVIWDVYVIGALLLWTAMQKRCFEFSVSTLYLNIIILCQIPQQIIRWIILCWKAPVFMVAQIVICILDIIITLIRTHFGKGWEEIQEMNKFALGEFADLITRALSIGSNLIEITMVSIMLNQIITLYYQMHPEIASSSA
jgi:hypothetical protein